MMAPDGLCKTFDADANGYVRGEGCGILVLKRFSDALRDNNLILAVIRGSAVNQDGLSNIRFTAKTIERLCDTVRRMVEDVRAHERKIQELCVRRSTMPRPHFIKAFPGNELNLDWVATEVASGKPYAAQLGHYAPAILEEQQKLLAIQTRIGIPLKELKDINKRMSTGEAKARRAKREMTEANLRLVISIAKKYHPGAGRVVRRNGRD
jgi:hypothetical protein